jgi:hypothetical protein
MLSHFEPPPPPTFNQEKADAPPTGFAFVLGAAPAAFGAPTGVVTATGAWLSFLAPSLTAVVDLLNALSGPLRRLPSSKNLLLPSPPRLGLEEPGAFDVEVVENVRVADLGFRTLMPDSLRW